MGIFTLATPMFPPLRGFFNSPQSYAEEKAVILLCMFWILQNSFPLSHLLNFGTINRQPGPNTMYGVGNISNLYLRKKSSKNQAEWADEFSSNTEQFFFLTFLLYLSNCMRQPFHYFSLKLKTGDIFYWEKFLTNRKKWNSLILYFLIMFLVLLHILSLANKTHVNEQSS